MTTTTIHVIMAVGFCFTQYPVFKAHSASGLRQHFDKLPFVETYDTLPGCDLSFRILARIL